jgi:Ca-activated chloride channel family protein
VLANAASVVASVRQVEAAEAYARGDVARAQAIIEGNVRDLQAAATAAPAAAPKLAAQWRAYETDQRSFAASAPASDQGRAAAKSSAAKNLYNHSRAAGF